MDYFDIEIPLSMRINCNFPRMYFILSLSIKRLPVIVVDLFSIFVLKSFVVKIVFSRLYAFVPYMIGFCVM